CCNSSSFGSPKVCHHWPRDWVSAGAACDHSPVSLKVVTSWVLGTSYLGASEQAFSATAATAETRKPSIAGRLKRARARRRLALGWLAPLMTSLPSPATSPPEAARRALRPCPSANPAG